MRPCVELTLLALILMAPQRSHCLTRCPDKSKLIPFFLSCLRDQINADFDRFEAEYVKAVENLVQKCFIRGHESVAYDDGVCVFAQHDYNADAFNDTNGPLKNCPICRQVTMMLKKFLLTTDEQRLKRFRTLIAETVVKDFGPCLGEYAYDKLPDVEAGEYKGMVQKLEAINLYMIARARLMDCQRQPGLNPGKPRGLETRFCMSERGVMRDWMPQQCQAVQHCAVADITKVCCARIRQAIDHNCECMKNKKQYYIDRLLSASTTLADARTAQECNQILVELFKSDDGVNWMSTIDKTVQLFIPNVKMSAFLRGMCSDFEDLIESGDRTKLDTLLSNIDGMLSFTALTFDAMFSHVHDRFCHCRIDCSQAFGPADIS